MSITRNNFILLCELLEQCDLQDRQKLLLAVGQMLCSSMRGPLGLGRVRIQDQPGTVIFAFGDSEELMLNSVFDLAKKELLDG